MAGAGEGAQVTADLKPGWSRYFCLRCRRRLQNDPSLKHDNRADTVSPEDGEHWRHDGCGGKVALSGRDVSG